MTSVRTVGIIGGGMAGLAAGGLLARAGIQVQLFETNGKIGGCCATTAVDGYTFNDGALYLALPTMLDHVFAQVGLDRPSALPLRKISAPQTTVLPNGDVFTPCDDGVKWLVYDTPTVTLPELAPAGGSVIELYLPVRRDLPIDAWSEERKEAVLARAVEVLARVHTLDIAVKRLVSPKDFRDTLHLVRGAVYGLSPEVAPWNHFPHRTPVRGLYQSGQTSYPGYSVARAAMAGILAAEALLAE